MFPVARVGHVIHRPARYRPNGKIIIVARASTCLMRAKDLTREPVACLACVREKLMGKCPLQELDIKRSGSLLNCRVAVMQCSAIMSGR